MSGLVPEGTGGRRPRSVRAWLSGLGVVAVTGSGLVAASLPAAAATSGCTTASTATRTGSIGGIVRPLGLAAAPQCASFADTSGPTGEYANGSSPPLLNHGGPVMSTQSAGDQVVVTPIYWAPSGYSFTASYKNLVNTYLADLAADSGKTTNVFATTYQYSGSNGAINEKFSVGTAINDTTAYPSAGCTTNGGSIYSDASGYSTCLDDAQVQAEIAARVAAQGLTSDFGHMYVMFLPKGVETCFYAGNPSYQQCSINSTASAAFCAYHSYFGASGSPTVYANMPFPIYGSATGYSCTSENLNGSGVLQQPNGDVDADVEISPLSHEMAEAITDPKLNAWFDLAGYENGDECAYIYGTLSGSSPGYYNQTVNGHHYLTQEEFSNSEYALAHDACLQQISAVTPATTTAVPATGPASGGQTVTITGTGFPGATAVTFGGVAASSFTILDATHISATAPAHAAGAATVTVTTAAGTGGTAPYTFVAAPTVTSVAPTAGPLAGGQSIAILGSGFTGATAVSLGGTAASTFTIDSDAHITATTPAKSAGTYDVTVTNVGGTSATSGSDQYTYVPVPIVTAVSPNAGPLAGGQTVTITGTDLAGVTAVSFGATLGTNITPIDGTHVSATTPAESAGTVDVTVTTPGGTSATGAADQYSFVPAPTVTSVSPNAGPLAGGGDVAITGTDLAGASAVDFGATPATGFSVDSGTQVTATVPAGSAGTVDVTVTTPGGTGATGAPDQYTYVAAPTVSGVSPDAGPSAGGVTVTITGTGLSGATAVDFGGTAAPPFTIDDDSHITVTTPAGAPGTVDVTVTTAGGTSATGAVDQYTYVVAPAVSHVSSTAGPVAGGKTITITGTDFTGASAVTFGGVNATTFTVDSPSQITATTPAHAAGTVHLRVTTVGGTSAAVTADRYTYLARPSVGAVSPAYGSKAGGLVVTVTGAHFAPGATVRFGSTPGTSVSIVSSTKLKVHTPAHAAGAVDVFVTTPGGKSAAVSADRYTFTSRPTVTALSSSSGSHLGGTLVTITGTHFVPGAKVLFGSAAASSVTFVSATRLRARTPSHATGAVHVFVSTPGWTSPTSAVDRFTFT